MSQFWNERYAEHEAVYGLQPNEFFKEQIDKLPPGKLLLPGEGEGRNAIYAAQQGWDVTAFDSSDVAIKKALKRAEQLGVHINYVHTDMEGFTAAAESFDAVGIVYFHLPPQARIVFHERVIQWLKPGGCIIMEVFNPEQLSKSSGGPKDITMLYDAAMLEEDFQALSDIHINMTETQLNEGDFHQGIASVTRMVARKV